jgi:hypothetical protein
LIINIECLPNIPIEQIDFMLISDKFNGHQKFTPAECHKKFCEIILFCLKSNLSDENTILNQPVIKIENEINQNPNLKKCFIGWKTNRKFETNKYYKILQKTYETFKKVKNSDRSKVPK